MGGGFWPRIFLNWLFHVFIRGDVVCFCGLWWDCKGGYIHSPCGLWGFMERSKSVIFSGVGGEVGSSPLMVGMDSCERYAGSG